jgi:hypothetical protein
MPHDKYNVIHYEFVDQSVEYDTFPDPYPLAYEDTVINYSP